MRLAYRAFEKTGREVADVIEAKSLEEATDKLRHEDLFVAEIGPIEDQPLVRPAKAQPAKGGSRRLKNLLMFTRQLYVLMRVGTPLADGLRALERQTRDDRAREVIENVRRKLEGGISLSKAMEATPGSFDVVYRSMIAAGEKSGKLTLVLDRLAQLTRKRVRIRRNVQAAMIYPALLVFVSTVVFVVMLMIVVPRFGELFAGLGVPVPPTTALLISLSDGLRSYWPVPLALLIGTVLGVRYYLRTPGGKATKDTVSLRLPYIGRLVRNFATARIARLLGVLLDSHLPVLEALQLTANAVSNGHYKRLLARTEQAVSQGKAISSAFEDTNLISPSVYEAMRSGEQTGQVSALLIDMADFMDEENETAMKTLVGLLEPVILILMGVVVGFVALAMFTPLFDATVLAGGG